MILSGRFNTPDDAIIFCEKLVANINKIVLVTDNRVEEIDRLVPADRIALNNGTLYLYQGRATWWKINCSVTSDILK